MDYKIQKDGLAYTSWRNLFWPPVTQKSRILVKGFNGQTYQFTNEVRRWVGRPVNACCAVTILRHVHTHLTLIT